jgi:IS30 family transposase
MCQVNYNTERTKGKHLTYDDRKLIAHLYNYQNKSYTEIAEELNCHRTTISREIKKGLILIKRGIGQDDLEYYDYDVAQRKYDNNATAKGPNLKIGNNHKLAKFIEKKVKEKYSPEVIAHLIDEKDEFVMSLSYKTIYNYIDNGILMIDREDLVFGNYRDKSKKRKSESTKTTRHKKGRTIRDRPKAADKRSEIGHFEMDLVEGQKDSEEPNLLVLTDRKTRKEIIEKIPSKTQEAVIKGLDRIERRMGVVNFRNTFKSITTDNGREFYDYERIEESFTGSSIKRTELYYCDAYCSWQRGSNENNNRFIRRFLPKGTSFKGLSRKLVKSIQKFINTYPRRMFDFQTSKKLFEHAKGVT